MITKTMWRVLAVIVGIAAAVVLLAAVLHAQVSVHPTSFSNTVDTGGEMQAVPTSLTCIVGPAATCGTVLDPSRTPYVCGFSFQATGQTIILEDNQPTPVALLNSVLGTSMPVLAVTALGNFSDSQCIPFVGGVYWQQTGGSAGLGYVVVKFN